MNDDVRHHFFGGLASCTCADPAVISGCDPSRTFGTFFGGDEQSVAAASAGYCTSVGDVEIHGGAEEL